MQSTEEAPKLEYNRPDTGKLNDSTAQEEWTLLPDSKDRITITVDRTSDTLVPQIELHDSQDNVIAKANQDTSYAHASISNFTLPAPGQYTIVVRRYNGQAGMTHGTYKVLVSQLGTGEDGFNPTVAEGMIQLGQPRDGTVNAAKWQDSWAFQTKDNSPVTITVSRMGGTLVPTVKLFDSNWKQVASGQPDETFAIAKIIGYIPSGPSQYFVVVSRIDGTNGGTTGDYHLVVVQG
ncbi:MAG: hypothetical protein ACYDBJ_22360 [Aggregatilineales bacterium]